MEQKNVNAKIAEIQELLSKAMGKLDELRGAAAAADAEAKREPAAPAPAPAPVAEAKTAEPAARPASAGAPYPYAFPGLEEAKRRIYVGSTDHDWFKFIENERAEILNADTASVNCWRVGGSEFSVLQPGEIYLFKVNIPKLGDMIVGGAFFQEYKEMTTDETWAAFGRRNGSPDQAAFTKAVKGQMLKVRSYADKVGCVVLKAPFFFDKADYVKRPADWGSPFIAGKAYDCGSGTGADLFAKASATISAAK